MRETGPDMQKTSPWLIAARVIFTFAPILGGLLTALTDETIQMFSDGRSSQLTDVWLDLSGAMAGILVGLFCLALCRMCWLLYKHRNED